MKPTILVVDDDKFLLGNLGKKLAETTSFAVRTAENGLAAIKAVQEKAISLVVTDLVMPGLDGFGLLDYVARNCPDIPVIVMTAHGKPKTRDVVTRQGAVAYLEKPFKIDDLAQIIQKTLAREAEGGKLHNVSLDMFIQLVEMEQKTCTIRVTNHNATRQGVLFFRDGVFLNARTNGKQANPAAYEIFGWEQVTLSIENACRQQRKLIEGDLQGILFEAMRLKDEHQDQGQAEGSVVSEAANVAQAPPSASPDVHEPDPAPASSAGLDILRRQIEKALGNDKSALEDLYLDSARAPLVTQLSRLGGLCGGGSLKFCCMDQGGAAHCIVLPGKGGDPMVLLMKNVLQRDRIIQALSI